MAIEGNLVVSVTPKKIKAYFLDEPSNAEPVVHTLTAFDHTVMLAAVGFLPGSTQRRLGANDEDEAMPTICACVEDEYDLHCITLKPISRTRASPPQYVSSRATLSTNVSDGTDYVLSSCLSSVHSSVSWIQTGGERGERCAFVNAKLTAAQSPAAEPSKFIFNEPDMPALYFFAVRDFDEALGLLVVANGFGEMAL